MHEGRREQVRRQLQLTDPEEQASMDRARAAEAARHARKEERRQELLRDRDYRIILWADRYMDRYGIDALIGLIPYAGDVVGFLFVIPGLRLSTRKIKSLPLTLAILYNFLIDACVGLVPFIGPVLDFFFRANSRTAKLVRGFVEDDRETIREVNRRAGYFVVAIIVLIILVALLAYLFLLFCRWLIELGGGGVQ